ncbi:MAG: hypothetical protein JSU95_11440 [Betaproteobacteria bacterium]|nr:MAG: hypothetical protein JSU95_11440 [Betaproteobacteria bacterium]
MGRKVRHQFKTPDHDGTTHTLFERLNFLARRDHLEAQSVMFADVRLAYMQHT